MGESVALGADGPSVRRVLDAMRDDMHCYIVPSTGEYRLM